MVRKHLIYCVFINILLLSCAKQQSDYKKISQYFETKNIELNGGYSRIIVLTDNGCPSCTKSLARTTEYSAHDTATLWLITSRGSNVKIDDYIHKKNVVIDWQMNEKELPIFSETKIVYLKTNAIDTIINIDAYGLDEQLEYVRNKLENKKQP
jgi:hypothetical protein